MAEKNQRLTIQFADTPPSSPVQPNSRNESAEPANRRIKIDDKGVHDFDLGKTNSNGSRRLQKFSRRTQASSISSMADIPQRTPSDSSDTSSVRKRLSSLLIGKSDLHKTNSGRSNNSRKSSIEIQDDPLPDTKQELEARLNYHLAELDMLKKTINTANEAISQHFERYQILRTRTPSGMDRAMEVQNELIKQARQNRDSWVHFVSFHRRQLERIKEKRVEIERQAGLEPTLPQVYNELWGDEEWRRLFAP